MAIKQKNINRDSFIFYRSFFESLSGLSLEEKAKCYDAIADYALNNCEPVLEPVTRVVFTLVKPQIDANKKKFENGLKGGRPSSVKENNQSITKPKPKHNQSITKPKPNVNVNVNVNVNDKEKDLKENNNKIITKEKKLKDIWTEEEITAFGNNLNKKLDSVGLKDFDRKFCQDMFNKFTQYGDNMLITEKQLVMLETVFS